MRHVRSGRTASGSAVASGLFCDEAHATTTDVNNHSATTRAEDAEIRLTGLDPVLEWHDAPLERASHKCLDDHSDSLSAADARGAESVALAASPQGVNQVRRDPRAGRGQRMAHRNGAAVHVELLARNLQFALDGAHLWRERDRKSTRLNSSHPSISYAV